MITEFLNGFCSIGLSFQSDKLRILYFAITTLVFFFCTIFCREYMKGEHKNRRFFVFWTATYLAVVGFLFAADFFTLFMFFEIMSFASTVWVLQEENPESDYSGRLYLRISVICGMVMLFGIFLIRADLGTVDFKEISGITAAFASSTVMKKRIFAAAIMLLVGFGAKAGVFLVHVWLPRAHTVAPAPASAVLSGILTKTGIIGIMITASVLGMINDETYGTILLVLGGCTMFTGAFLAIFSNNLKRTLACSSVSQIGFIVTGISCMVLLGDGFSYTGTVLHMINHSTIKLVLFLIAGGVLKKTGSLLLNDIKGYGRNKPELMIPFAIGALSISGIPGFSGYVSKTILHEAVESVNGSIAGTVSVVFTITGGMTLCYMLKLFVCLFVDRGEAEKKPGLSVISKTAVIVPAFILLMFGILSKTFAKIPCICILSEYADAGGVHLDFSEVAEMKLFAFGTMKGGLISVLIGIVLYFGFVRTLLIGKKNGEVYYRQGFPFWFDLEKYVYRPVVMYFLPFVLAFICRLFDKVTDFTAYFLGRYVFGPLKNSRTVKIGDGVSDSLGLLLDRLSGRIKHREKESYAEVLAVAKEETGAFLRMIERSLSLSLLLFSTGLLITLIYMLFK